MLKPNPKLSVKKITTNLADWQGCIFIPAPGEAVITHMIDTEEYQLRIGDGKHNLRELPVIWEKGEYLLPHCKNDTCANCGHLCVINRNKIYAVCDETGKVFELWHMDTRKTDACDDFVPK